MHASQSRSRMRREVRAATQAALSDRVNQASRGASTKRHGPGDQPPHDVAHDARPASAPDAEAPSGSGDGGGIAGHDPNGMRTHVRFQEVPGRSHKAGTFAPVFPGEAAGGPLILARKRPSHRRMPTDFKGQNGLRIRTRTQQPVDI